MKSNIINILKKELREVFRDKKSLAMMLMVPLMIPLIVLGMSTLFDMQINGDTSDYNKLGFTYELSEQEKELLESANINYSVGDYEHIKNQYEQNEIYAYVDKDNNNYIINYDDGEEKSAVAKKYAEAYLNSYKNILQNIYLSENSIEPSEVLDIITITTEALEEEDNFFSNYMTTYAFLFIIMAITVSATYPSTDTTAGEKERGTLETLLTFPIKAKDIIIGKLISVSISSIITGIVSLLLAIVTLLFVNDKFEIYKGINLMPSWQSMIVASIIIILFSVLISGLCILIASKFKTFKEAQSALTPLTFVAFFPSMIAFMINAVTTPLLSLVPFLNFSLIFTDVNAGNINLTNIILMIGSTIVYSAFIIFLVIKQYRRENILFND